MESEDVPVIVILDVDVLTAWLTLAAVVTSVVVQAKVAVPVQIGLIPEITADPVERVARPLIVWTVPAIT